MHQPTYADGRWILPASGLIDVHRDGVDSVMPISALRRVEGGHDDENEWCAWLEFHLDGQIVHRSARLHLKKGLLAEGLAATFA